VTRSASELFDIDGGVADFPGWLLVEVSGRHRERFLASQLTSDVAGLPVGGSQLSSLLDRSGRLQGFFYLRKRPDRVDLLIPDDAADACVDQLEGRVVADDVVFERRPRVAMRLALGPAALVAAERLEAKEFMPVAGWGTLGVATWSAADLDLPELDPDELEARRVLGGPPVWGRDARAGQLVNETVLLDAAVSFDKGCYLGQETVAKLASHRGAARGPALLELVEPMPGAASRVGERFAVGGRERAGEIVAEVRHGGRSWLQLQLHRELRVPGRRLRCRFPDGDEIEGAVHAAPLLSAPSRSAAADRLTVAASAAFADDDADRALELLHRAIAIAPGWSDAWESKGVILGRLGRYDEAIAVMHELLEIDPSAHMAHSNLSLFYNRLGDIEAAERHLALAAGASFAGPGPAAADAAADDSAEREADRARREEMFRAVLDIDPDDALAHFGLGELAIERQRFADAVGHLERAVAADPGHCAALLALGRAHEGLGDSDGARRTYERGVGAAAKRGDLATAKKMQERLNGLTR
jgi:folate-binding protein YgfZ